MGKQSVKCPMCGSGLDRIKQGHSDDGKHYVERYRCQKAVAPAGKRPECIFEINAVGKNKADARGRLRRGMPVMAKKMAAKRAEQQASK